MASVSAQQNYCPDVIRNGGFEVGNIGFAPAEWRAGASGRVLYDIADRTEGTASLRLGLIAEENQDSRSIAWQTFRVPQVSSSAADASVILSFRYRPIYDTDPGIEDLQYVELFNDFNSQLIGRLVERRHKDDAWSMKQFDLTPYSGQQVTLYFGVYNDGVAGKMAMYVDDVQVQCTGPLLDGSDPEPANSSQRSSEVAAVEQVQPFFTSTPTPTPTPTPTSTPTPTPTPTTTSAAPAEETATPTWTATHTPTITPTATNTPPTPTMQPSTCGNVPMAPMPQGCQSIILNSSFETNAEWHIGDDPVPPVYVSEQRATGGRAMLLGNRPGRGPAEWETYSSVYQHVIVPPNVNQLQLRWRRFDVSEEGASANPSNLDDRQDVIILSYPHLEPIEIVSRLRCDTEQWEEFSVDLNAERYSHDRNIAVYFNVYNDGQGGRSWSYLDDVQLLVCPAPGNVGNANSGYLQPKPFVPTSTFTPNAIARATYPPATAVLPTATIVPTSTSTPVDVGGTNTGSNTSTNANTIEPVAAVPQSQGGDVVVITVVVTPTPDGGESTGTDSGLVRTLEDAGEAIEDAIGLNNEPELDLPGADTEEPINRFLSGGSPWFNWLTSCGILLGILAVIAYFAWGILRTLADGPEPYEDMD